MLEKLVLILSLRMRFFKKCYFSNEVYSKGLKSNANLDENSLGRCKNPLVSGPDDN